MASSKLEATPALIASENGDEVEMNSRTINALSFPKNEFFRADLQVAEDLSVKETVGYEAKVLFSLGLKPDKIHAFLELSSSHMKMSIERVEGDTFVLFSGMELRSRLDKFGTLVFWPEVNGRYRYRPLGVGGLANLFFEGRFDVAPCRTIEVSSSFVKGRRLGFPTRTVFYKTSLGKAEVELAKWPELVSGGELLMRMLAEFFQGLLPSSGLALDEGEVPIRALLSRESKDGKMFDFQFSLPSYRRRSDLSSSSLASPPSGAVFYPGSDLDPSH